MPYSKTVWADRVVERPMTFTLQNNGDGTTTLISAEGTILDAGTPITSANLNKLETQYEEVAKDFLGLTGGTISGNLLVNGSQGITVATWGTISANTGGDFLIGNNVYTDAGGVYKYKNTHASLGARGLLLDWGAPANSSLKTFDTGSISATKDATFTPTIWTIWHSGNLDPNTKANLSGATFTGTVNAPTLQEGGTSLASKYASLSGATFTGAVSISGNSQGLSMKAGATADHVYIGFYADSQDQATRSGFFGFTSAGSTTMTMQNDMAGGNIRIGANSGRTYFGISGAQFLDANADGSFGIYQSAGSYIKMYSGQHDIVLTGGYILSFTNGQLKNTTSGGGNLVLASGDGATNYAVVRGTDVVYIQANASCKVVAPLTTNSYKPILASAFTVNSYREDKDDIIEAPSGALNKVLATKIYDYHLENELEETIIDENGEMIKKPLDKTKVKKRKGMISDEAPQELVFENGIDLYGMTSLLWQALQEMNEEIKKLKQGKV